MTSKNVPELDKAIDLAEDAEDLAAEAETLAACIRELHERINSGAITRDDRTELAGEMLAITERLTAYALSVLA